MNVLVLTPDAVGSTLLQRLITVYMQFHSYDRPVINLHELTNGITSYYSEDFNRVILGKPVRGEWGYFQTLSEIVKLLHDADHYKTSRLAQYHIQARNDPLPDQINFYKYLNDNFYIIACKRKNVFEHALSWAITRFTKRLNVFAPHEKVDYFWDLYKDGIDIDQDLLISILDRYRDYISWSERYFSIGTYFNYERDLPNIEEFILKLPIFAGQGQRKSWKDIYGIEFNDWNKCHYYTSDLGSLVLEGRTQEKLDYGKLTRKDSPVAIIQPGLVSHLPAAQKEFLDQHQEKYIAAFRSTWKMVDLGIMITGVPIKKQTFKEKKYMIKNFDQCLETYNIWAGINPEIAEPMTSDTVMIAMDKERQDWTNNPDMPLSLPGPDN
jgi:hypothetical protein